MKYISTWTGGAPLKRYSAACMAAIGVVPVRFYSAKYDVGDVVKYPFEGVTHKIMRGSKGEEIALACQITKFHGWENSTRTPDGAGVAYIDFACVAIEEVYTEEEIAEANGILREKEEENLTKREEELVKQLVESVVLS